MSYITASNQRPTLLLGSRAFSVEVDNQLFRPLRQSRSVIDFDYLIKKQEGSGYYLYYDSIHKKPVKITLAMDKVPAHITVYDIPSLASLDQQGVRALHGWTNLDFFCPYPAINTHVASEVRVGRTFGGRLLRLVIRLVFS